MRKLLISSFILFVSLISNAQITNDFNGYGVINSASTIGTDTFRVSVSFTGAFLPGDQYIIDDMEVGDKFFFDCQEYNIINIVFAGGGFSTFDVKDISDAGQPLVGGRYAIYRRTQNSNLVRPTIVGDIVGITQNEYNCIIQYFINQVDNITNAAASRTWIAGDNGMIRVDNGDTLIISGARGLSTRVSSGDLIVDNQWDEFIDGGAADSLFYVVIFDGVDAYKKIRLTDIPALLVNLSSYVEFEDSNTVFVTPYQLDGLAFIDSLYEGYGIDLNWSDPVRPFVKVDSSQISTVTNVRREIRDSLLYYVQLADSTTVFLTPSQLSDSLANYVKYSDSLNVFVTPTQLADTISLIAQVDTFYRDNGALYIVTPQRTFEVPDVPFDSSFVYGVVGDSMLVVRDSLSDHWTAIEALPTNEEVQSYIADSLVNYVAYNDSTNIFITPIQMLDSIEARKDTLAGPYAIITVSPTVFDYCSSESLDTLTVSAWVFTGNGDDPATDGYSVSGSALSTRLINYAYLGGTLEDSGEGWGLWTFEAYFSPTGVDTSDTDWVFTLAIADGEGNDIINQGYPFKMKPVCNDPSELISGIVSDSISTIFEDSLYQKAIWSEYDFQGSSVSDVYVPGDWTWESLYRMELKGAEGSWMRFWEPGIDIRTWTGSRFYVYDYNTQSGIGGGANAWYDTTGWYFIEGRDEQVGLEYKGFDDYSELSDNSLVPKMFVLDQISDSLATQTELNGLFTVSNEGDTVLLHTYYFPTEVSNSLGYPITVASRQVIQDTVFFKTEFGPLPVGVDGTVYEIHTGDQSILTGTTPTSSDGLYLSGVINSGGIFIPYTEYNEVVRYSPTDSVIYRVTPTQAFSASYNALLGNSTPSIQSQITDGSMTRASGVINWLGQYEIFVGDSLNTLNKSRFIISDGSNDVLNSSGYGRGFHLKDDFDQEGLRYWNFGENGAGENGDYSSLLDNSLVPKAYVDDALSLVSGVDSFYRVGDTLRLETPIDVHDALLEGLLSFGDSLNYYVTPTQLSDSIVANTTVNNTSTNYVPYWDGNSWESSNLQYGAAGTIAFGGFASRATISGGAPIYSYETKDVNAAMYIWRNSTNEANIVLRSGTDPNAQTAYGGQIRGLSDRKGLRFTDVYSITEYMRITSTGLGIFGSPSYPLDVNSPSGIRIARGTTANRPTGADGVLRYNSDDDQFEGWNGATAAYDPLAWKSEIVPIADLPSANRVLYSDGSTIAGDDGLVYDPTTGNLGLGDTTPDWAIDIEGDSTGIKIPVSSEPFNLPSSIRIPEAGVLRMDTSETNDVFEYRPNGLQYGEVPEGRLNYQYGKWVNLSSSTINRSFVHKGVLYQGHWGHYPITPLDRRVNQNVGITWNYWNNGYIQTSASVEPTSLIWYDIHATRVEFSFDTSTGDRNAYVGSNDENDVWTTSVNFAWQNTENRIIVSVTGVGTVFNQASMNTNSTRAFVEYIPEIDSMDVGFYRVGVDTIFWEGRYKIPDNCEPLMDVRTRNTGIGSRWIRIHNIYRFTSLSTFDLAEVSSQNIVVQNGLQWTNDTLGIVQDSLDAWSLWEQSGSDVYYNSGKVGIGTASPTTNMEIALSNTGDTKDQGIIVSRNGGYVGFANQTSDASGNFLPAFIGKANYSAPLVFRGSQYSSGDEVLRFQATNSTGTAEVPSTDDAITFYNYGTRLITIEGSGEIGINIDNPLYSIDNWDTNASMRFRPHDSTPTGSEGVLYADDSEDHFLGWNAATASWDGLAWESEIIPIADLPSNTSVIYSNGSTIAGSTAFNYDATNNRIGLGDTTPDWAIDIEGDSTAIRIPVGPRPQSLPNVANRVPETGAVRVDTLSGGFQVGYVPESVDAEYYGRWMTFNSPVNFVYQEDSVIYYGHVEEGTISPDDTLKIYDQDDYPEIIGFGGDWPKYIYLNDYEKVVFKQRFLSAEGWFSGSSATSRLWGFGTYDGNSAAYVTYEYAWKVDGSISYINNGVETALPVLAAWTDYRLFIDIDPVADSVNFKAIIASTDSVAFNQTFPLLHDFWDLYLAGGSQANSRNTIILPHKRFITLDSINLNEIVRNQQSNLPFWTADSLAAYTFENGLYLSNDTLGIVQDSLDAWSIGLEEIRSEIADTLNTAKLDSITLVQDSILIGWIRGVEASRDTITGTGSGGSSLWSLTGSDIYRNSAVTINSTTAPSYELDLYGAAWFQPGTAPVGAEGVLYADDASNHLRYWRADNAQFENIPTDTDIIPITDLPAANRVIYSDGSTIAGDANFTWDSNNGRLWVEGISPNNTSVIRGTISDGNHSVVRIQSPTIRSNTTLATFEAYNNTHNSRIYVGKDASNSLYLDYDYDSYAGQGQAQLYVAGNASGVNIREYPYAGTGHNVYVNHLGVRYLSAIFENDLNSGVLGPYVEWKEQTSANTWRAALDNLNRLIWARALGADTVAVWTSSGFRFGSWGEPGAVLHSTGDLRVDNREGTSLLLAGFSSDSTITDMTFQEAADSLAGYLPGGLTSVLASYGLAGDGTPGDSLRVDTTTLDARYINEGDGISGLTATYMPVAMSSTTIEDGYIFQEGTMTDPYYVIDMKSSGVGDAGGIIWRTVDPTDNDMAEIIVQKTGDYTTGPLRYATLTLRVDGGNPGSPRIEMGGLASKTRISRPVTILNGIDSLIGGISNYLGGLNIKSGELGVYNSDGVNRLVVENEVTGGYSNWLTDYSSLTLRPQGNSTYGQASIEGIMTSPHNSGANRDGGLRIRLTKNDFSTTDPQFLFTEEATLNIGDSVFISKDYDLYFQTGSKGVVFPRWTTATRSVGIDGLIAYNTDTDYFEMWDGGTSSFAQLAKTSDLSPYVTSNLYTADGTISTDRYVTIGTSGVLDITGSDGDVNTSQQQRPIGWGVYTYNDATGNSAGLGVAADTFNVSVAGGLIGMGPGDSYGGLINMEADRVIVPNLRLSTESSDAATMLVAADAEKDVRRISAGTGIAINGGSALALDFTELPLSDVIPTVLIGQNGLSGDEERYGILGTPGPNKMLSSNATADTMTWKSNFGNDYVSDADLTIAFSGYNHVVRSAVSGSPGSDNLIVLPAPSSSYAGSIINITASDADETDTYQTTVQPASGSIYAPDGSVLGTTDINNGSVTFQCLQTGASTWAWFLIQKDVVSPTRGDFVEDANLTITPTDLEERSQFSVYAICSGSASANVEVKLPTATASLVGREIVVAGEDANGTYNIVVSPVTGLFRTTNGGTQASYTVSSAVLTFHCMKVGASSYAWIYQ